MAIIRLDSNNNNYCENKQDKYRQSSAQNLFINILKYSIYEGSYIIDMHLIDD
ncbi:hypothetical protein ACQJ6P_04250 [Helicobacter pylori]